LLRHHACHTVDLFQYQTGRTAEHRQRDSGSTAPRAWDRHGDDIRSRCRLADPDVVAVIQQRALLVRSSYICDNGTYKAVYDTTVDGNVRSTSGSTSR
jgi:2-hydroxy-4-carboxymuconate semialdehyde hemiacetal dehydrogenase